MSKSVCQPETILSSPSCDIQYCADCRMIHLTMGAISIRMPEEHFAQFAKDIGQGALMLSPPPHMMPAMNVLM